MPKEHFEDMTPHITPEQRLGSIIIAAFKGGYADSVPRWSWELYGAKVNFEALHSAFDKYLEAKIREQEAA